MAPVITLVTSPTGFAIAIHNAPRAVTCHPLIGPERGSSIDKAPQSSKHTHWKISSPCMESAHSYISLLDSLSHKDYLRCVIELQSPSAHQRAPH